MENKNETLEITNNELEYDNLIDLKSTLQVELNDILDELSSLRRIEKNYKITSILKKPFKTSFGTKFKIN